MEWFLEGNQTFRDNAFHEQRDLFHTLTVCQQPRALWIGCSDSRVPSNLVVNADPGCLFVHRNVGNIVAPGDPNLGAVLEYAVEHLRVPEIILCGHSGCGAMQALAEGGAEGPEEGPIPRWLRHAAPALEAVQQGPGLPPEDHLSRLVEENVRLQLRHLREFPCVARATAASRLQLHGVVYNLASGELNPVGAATPSATC
jgi:carbonic anhydrase